MEDPVHSPLEGGRADCARAARPLELHLDHSSRHICEQKRQIPSVSLNRRSHEFDQAVELGQSFSPLLVAEHRFGVSFRSPPLHVFGRVWGIHFPSTGRLLTVHDSSSRRLHRRPGAFGPTSSSSLPRQGRGPNTAFESDLLEPSENDRSDPPWQVRCLVPMEPPAPPLGPIGLVLPTFVQDTVPPWAVAPGTNDDPAADLAAICAHAEELGADGLWACDHLFWHGPSLECMVALTVAATATRRVHLGTCVIQLPLRQAPAVAKQAASMQSISQGRLILGVGVGSHAGEYEQAGIDYHTRGRLLDAGIAELRRSWASGQHVAGGDTRSTGAVRYRQLPMPSPIPIWVGGSSEAALRRAAGLADGWMPLFLNPTEYGDAVERLAKEVDRAGRAPSSVTPAIVLFVSIDDDPGAARTRGTQWMSSLYGIPAKAFERHLICGTAAEVAGLMADFRHAGAEHVAVYVTADQPLEQFERLVSALPAAGFRPEA